jgi:hypothetical protein
VCGNKSTVLPDIEFYVDCCDKITTSALFPSKNHIRVDGMPDTCLLFARKILQACTDSHNCYQPRHRHDRVPKRLVSVRPGGLAYDGIRVLDSASSSIPSSASYAALSYCWGPESTTRSKILCLTKENLAYMSNGIEMSQLPPVFQDAVKVTRSLGLQYLWLDALCIAQGDREDWVHEGSNMGEYYANAFVTIAATASASCDESFLDINRYRKCREGIEVPGSNPSAWSTRYS